MSWLSTLVHNNRGIVNALPGGGVIGSIFDPQQPSRPVVPLSTTFWPSTPTTIQVPSKPIWAPPPNPFRVPVGQGIRQPITTRSKTYRVAGQEVYSHYDTTTGPGAGYQMEPSSGGCRPHVRIFSTDHTCPPRYHLAKTPKLAQMGLCVKRRKTNYANGRAAMRAARRLIGTHRLMGKIERALVKVKGRHRVRSYGASWRARPCGCGR